MISSILGIVLQDCHACAPSPLPLFLQRTAYLSNAVHSEESLTSLQHSDLCTVLRGRCSLEPRPYFLLHFDFNYCCRRVNRFFFSLDDQSTCRYSFVCHYITKKIAKCSSPKENYILDYQLRNHKSQIKTNTDHHRNGFYLLSFMQSRRKYFHSPNYLLKSQEQTKFCPLVLLPLPHPRETTTTKDTQLVISLFVPVNQEAAL